MNNLIYVSSGVYAKNSANNIQTNCMYNALRDLLDPSVSTFLIRGKFWLFLKKTKLYNIFYRSNYLLYLILVVQIFNVLLYSKIHKIFDKKNIIFFSRWVSGPLIIIYLFNLKAVVFEFHDEPSNFDKYIIKFFWKKNYLAIAITNSLKENIYNQFPNINIIVEPDAHNFPILKKIKPIEINKSYTFGYFGALTEQKGVQALLSLKATLENQLKVFARTTHNEEWMHLLDARRLDHNEVRDEMMKVDFLIVFNCANEHTTICKYTSPLKLFEYAACGKPIISNKDKALGEILNDENSFIINLENENWQEQLFREIKKMKPHEYQSKATQLWQLSKRFTYESRALRIVNTFNGC